RCSEELQLALLAVHQIIEVRVERHHRVFDAVSPDVNAFLALRERWKQLSRYRRRLQPKTSQQNEPFALEAVLDSRNVDHSQRPINSNAHHFLTRREMELILLLQGFDECLV